MTGSRSSNMNLRIAHVGAYRPPRPVEWLSEEYGFLIRHFDSLILFKKALRDFTPDVAIFEVIPQETDSQETHEKLCDFIEQNSDLGILILAPSIEITEGLKNLDETGSRLVIMPVSGRELLGYVLMGLSRNTVREFGEFVAYGGLVINKDHMTTMCCGEKLNIDPNSSRILQYMLENAGRTVTRQQIIESALKTENINGNRSIDVYMHRLRKAIPDCLPKTLIKTVPSKGYCLCELRRNPHKTKKI